MLFNGEETEINKSKAAYYYKIAADYENTNAMFRYANMLLTGGELPKNKKESAKYFKIAAHQGHIIDTYATAKIPKCTPTSNTPKPENKETKKISFYP